MKLPNNILIVEDEAITQRYLKDILLSKGIDDIKLCDNAICAKRSLDTKECDLILMDINIKGSQDGISLSKEILQQYNIPIIFISAYSDEDTLEEVIELSPYGFITKPFSSKEVLATLSVAYKRFLTNSEVTNSDKIEITPTYHYELSSKTLYHKNQPVRLNTNQDKLLYILIKNINNTVSFSELTREIWIDKDISNSSLRNLVYSIRKLAPALPIQTYSKLGYSITKI